MYDIYICKLAVMFLWLFYLSRCFTLTFLKRINDILSILEENNDFETGLMQTFILIPTVSKHFNFDNMFNFSFKGSAKVSTPL